MSLCCGHETIRRAALSVLLVAATAAPAASARAASRPGAARTADAESDEKPSNEGPPEDSPFGPPVDIPEEHVRWFSLMISPVLLAQPLIEITGEFRVGQDLGLAVIGGAGWVKPEQPDDPEAPPVSEDRLTVYEIGAQAHYYVYGSFTNGVMVGVEAIYLAAYDEAGAAVLRNEGVTVGGYGGYKRVLGNGVTIDLQLGIKKLAVRSVTSQESDVGALVNVKFGYTF